MQNSTVSGSHTTGVFVEKRRTGIGVEVNVGIDSEAVSVTLGILCWVGTGAQEIRINKKIGILNMCFIKRPHCGVRQLAGKKTGAISCTSYLDSSPLLHGLANLLFEPVRFCFKFFQFIQQFLPH